MAPPRSTGVDSRVSRPDRRAAVAARLLGVAPAQLDPPRRAVLLTPRRQRHRRGGRPRPEPPLGAHRRPVHKSTSESRRFSSGGDASRRFDLCTAGARPLSAASIPARSAAGPPAGARARQCGELVLPAARRSLFPVPMNDLRPSQSSRLMILLWARMRAASAARATRRSPYCGGGVASRSLMALAAAVVGPQLLCFVAVQVGHGCPNVSRGSDRCECPNRPLASSRVCSADALRSHNILQRLRWAMLSPSPPSSSVPALCLLQRRGKRVEQGQLRLDCVVSDRV